MQLTLYVLAGSHPCDSARLMLSRKGLDYRERELPPVFSRFLLPRLGFDGKTVPAIATGKERVQGTRSISRWLDGVKPEPRLFPAEPEASEIVAQAEELGEELQDVARHLTIWGLLRDREGLERRAALSKLPVPGPLRGVIAGAAIRQLGRIRGTSDATVRAYIQALPGMLDRIDDWVQAGVLGTDEPNAADCQLAPSLAVLLGMGDLHPLIAPRPAAVLVERLAASRERTLAAGVLPVPA